MTESDAEERATTCPHDGVAPRRNLGLQPKRPVSRHGLARFLSISEDINPDLSFGCSYVKGGSLFAAFIRCMA